MGRASHPVRKRLLRITYLKDKEDVEIIDTSTYNHFQAESKKERSPWQDQYWPVAQRSKYVLCPRGAGTSSSIRLFDMMEAGIAPVIISDVWVPPLGPNWSEFALLVGEKDIRNLYGIVKAHDSEWLVRAQKARKAYEDWFAPQAYWKSLIDSIRKIQQQQRVPESIYTRSLPLLMFVEQGRQVRIRSMIWMKGMIRKILSF